MQIERFNWQAERDAMRAPAYFRKAVAENGSIKLRGLSIEERVAAVLDERAYVMARLAGLTAPASAPAHKVKPGPCWSRVRMRRAA
jgi:hypothetical protein